MIMGGCQLSLLGNTIVLVPILLTLIRTSTEFPSVFARLRMDLRRIFLRYARDRRLRGLGYRRGLRRTLHTLSRIIPRWRRFWADRLWYPPTDGFVSAVGLNIFIIYRGMDLLRKSEWRAFLLIMTSLLLAWAIWKQRAWLSPCSGRVNYYHRRVFWADLHSILTGMSILATLSLNMPDFTRFGTVKGQRVGQVVACRRR